MSEGEAPIPEPEPQPVAAPPAEAEKDWKAEYEKTLAQSRKWEDRAKQNKAAADELTKVREASMTDLEKAVSEASASARAATLKEVGGDLVMSAVKAAAAGRPIDVDALVEGLDPARFLSEDGKPDLDAIQGWVDKIVPAVPETQQGWYPDLGQGARGSTVAPLNSTQLERDLRDALKMH